LKLPIAPRFSIASKGEVLAGPPVAPPITGTAEEDEVRRAALD
jgi:hypothetical protein